MGIFIRNLVTASQRTATLRKFPKVCAGASVLNPLRPLVCAYLFCSRLLPRPENHVTKAKREQDRRGRQKRLVRNNRFMSTSANDSLTITKMTYAVIYLYYLSLFYILHNCKFCRTLCF